MKEILNQKKGKSIMQTNQWFDKYINAEPKENEQIKMLQIENERLKMQLKEAEEASEDLKILRKNNFTLKYIIEAFNAIKCYKKAAQQTNRVGQIYELVYTKFILYLFDKYKIADDEWDVIDIYEKEFNDKRKKYVLQISGIRDKIRKGQIVKNFDGLQQELINFDEQLTLLIKQNLEKKK